LEMLETTAHIFITPKNGDLTRAPPFLWYEDANRYLLGHAGRGLKHAEQNSYLSYVLIYRLIDLLHQATNSQDSTRLTSLIARIIRHEAQHAWNKKHGDPEWEDTEEVDWIIKKLEQYLGTSFISYQHSPQGPKTPAQSIIDRRGTRASPVKGEENKEILLAQIEQLLNQYIQSGTSPRSRDTSLLERVVPLIFKVHSLINVAEAEELKAILDRVIRSESSVLDIYNWMKQNTPMRAISIGDKWFMAKKTETGDGSWGPWQKPEHRLDKKIDRDQHNSQMILAGQAILRGEYEILYKGVYATLFGKVIDEATPNLTPGSLETKLTALLQNFDSSELMKLLCLSFALHDYGKLLQQKIKINLSDTRPDAAQHRITGAYLSSDLLTKLGFNRFQTEIVTLLIRLHDAAWNLYCLDKYGDRNNYTTHESMREDIDTTISEVKNAGLIPADISEEKLRRALLNMVAIIGIADVHASGDRYLSDEFIANIVDKFAHTSPMGEDLDKLADETNITISKGMKTEDHESIINPAIREGNDSKILEMLETPAHIFITPKNGDLTRAPPFLWYEDANRYLLGHAGLFLIMCILSIFVSGCASNAPISSALAGIILPIIIGIGILSATIGLFFAIWRYRYPVSWYIWRLKYGLSDEAMCRAALALGELGDQRAFRPLVEALSSPYYTVRLSAAQSLGKLGNPEAIEFLIKKLKDSDNSVRKAADQSLRKLGATKEQLICGYILALRNLRNSTATELAVKALGELGDKRAVKPLLRELRDLPEVDRGSVAQSLLAIKDRDSSVIPLLKEELGNNWEEQLRIPILISQLLRALKEKGIDITYTSERALPVIIPHTKNNPDRQNTIIEIGFKLAKEGIDPGCTLEFGIPVVAQVAGNDNEKFRTGLEAVAKVRRDLQVEERVNLWGIGYAFKHGLPVIGNMVDGDIDKFIEYLQRLESSITLWDKYYGYLDGRYSVSNLPQVNAYRVFIIDIMPSVIQIAEDLNEFIAGMDLLLRNVITYKKTVKKEIWDPGSDGIETWGSSCGWAQWVRPDGYIAYEGVIYFFIFDKVLNLLKDVRKFKHLIKNYDQSQNTISKGMKTEDHEPIINPAIREGMEKGRIVKIQRKDDDFEVTYGKGTSQKTSNSSPLVEAMEITFDQYADDSKILEMLETTAHIFITPKNGDLTRAPPYLWYEDANR
ncbi:HEAT repeat domain-containing protein, partial [Candidatus Pacearchaeota archaeon]|nr:HEAT repeat domain-containing protein [Candidatus Pacearchaeota archaeon]